MTGFFLVASAPYGAHAEQHNPAKARTFGYVANAIENTVSVIATNNNTVVATIPVGGTYRSGDHTGRDPRLCAKCDRGYRLGDRHRP